MRHIESFFQDVGYGLRILRGAPVFTLVAVLSLALGIGANTAIFSLLNAVLLKSLPVQEPQRLAALDGGSWTNPIWEQIRDHQQAFDTAAAWGDVRLNLAQGGETHYVRGILASGSFFETLGVPALIGRTFTADDDKRGCGNSNTPVVLSYGFWHNRFGGTTDAIGQTIHLEGHPFTAIGVTPPSFFGLEVGQSFDAIIPLCSEEALRGAESALDQRSYWWLDIVGRLKPGSTLEQAQAALRALQPAVREATLPDNWEEEFRRRYLREPFSLSEMSTGVSPIRRRYQQGLYVLMTVVGMVLLIACANLANLQLARAAGRAKEIAIRASIGASRGRLIRQLLIESVLLGVLGAGAGVLVAQWAGRVLIDQLSTGRSTVFLDLSLDGRVLAFTAGVGILTGVLFGILPAFRAAGRQPDDVLRDTLRSHATTGKLGPGRLLVAIQVGLSLMLLFGAGLFIRSYSTLTHLDPGFDRAHVLLVTTDVRQAVPTPEQSLSLFERMLETVRAVPGIRTAAFSSVTPISGSTWQFSIEVDGFEPQSERDSGIHYNYVSPGYLDTIGTPLIAGRDFDEHDTAGSTQVAIVNETMAAKFYKGRNPIGDIFRRREGTGWKTIQIVGVMRDAKYRTLRDPVPPTAYAPIRQLNRFRTSVTFSVKSNEDLSALKSSIVSAVGGLHDRIALTFQTLESQVEDSLVQERLMATLFALFGVLALTVAAVGLAGLVSYAVVKRRGEIGIRSALGATPGSLVRLVLRDTLWLSSLGLLAGCLGGLLSARFAASMLYGLEPTDPFTLSVAMAILAAVSVFAAYVPARRAARIDPIECLRVD